MIGRKVKTQYMAIESDGRIRTFNSTEEVSDHYELPLEEVNQSLENKKKINTKKIWVRKYKHESGARTGRSKHLTGR